MTAQTIISRIEKLPTRERRKVFAWVDRKLTQREDAADLKAAREIKARIDAGESTVGWAQVKREISL